MRHFGCVVLLTGCVVAHAAGVTRYDVLTFGTAGDGVANDAPAIQRAIDAAAAAGGGRVVVPKGKYLCGPLFLKDHVEFYLERDATVQVSTAPESYPAGSVRRLLMAKGVTDITISGEGTIDGQATGDYGARWGQPQAPSFRTGILLLEECSDVTVRGIHVLNSDSWALHFKKCRNVTVEDVSIRNNYRRLNSDGIDPNSCVGVRIRRCNIVAGDDAIVVKATGPDASEDVVVEDCDLESATAGFKIGTESVGDFRNITVRNCRIRNTPVGVGIFIKDGATVEKVRVEEMSIQTCEPTHHAVMPLYINIEKRNPDAKIGAVRDVRFKDVKINSGSGILIQGLESSPVADIALSNIEMTVSTPEDYSNRRKPIGGARKLSNQEDTEFARIPSYAVFAHVSGLTVDKFDLKLSEELMKEAPRSALSGRDIRGGMLKRVTRSADVPGAPPAVDLVNCSKMTVKP